MTKPTPSNLLLQGLKDIIRWPRPSMPPVVQLERRWALEYGKYSYSWALEQWSWTIEWINVKYYRDAIDPRYGGSGGARLSHHIHRPPIHLPILPLGPACLVSSQRVSRRRFSATWVFLFSPKLPEKQYGFLYVLTCQIVSRKSPSVIIVLFFIFFYILVSSHWNFNII